MKTRLSDLYTLQMGKTPSRNVPEYWQGGTYQWASVSDLSQGGKYLAKTRERITEAAIEQSGIKEVPANTVVMSFKLSLGKVAITREPLFTNEAIMAFIPKDDRAPIAEYLFYQLQCHDWVKESANRAVMGVTLNKASLSKVEVTIPPKSEQERVTERLRHLDAQLHSCKITVNKLDELVKSRFIEMFGDYNLAPQKKEWSPISSVGIVAGGATPKTAVGAYWGGNAVWITPAELKDGNVFVNDSARKLTLEGIKSASLTLMPRNTVILSSRAPIGKVAIADCELYCNQGFKNIICGDTLAPRYLYELLRFNSDFLNSLGKGATFKEISKKTVEEIRIPVPSISRQREYASFAFEIDKLRFDALSPKGLFCSPFTKKCGNLILNNNKKCGNW